MVLGWRRAFCTSILKDDSPKPDPRPRIRPTRLRGLFSEPSTPRPVTSPTLRCRTAASAAPTPPPAPGDEGPQSPKLKCKTKSSPRFFHRSAPSSPRSLSTFSRLKSSLRLSKSRCGICLQSMKTGQGTAIFTAECGHGFHFPCITARPSPTCPICGVTWKETHLFTANNLCKRASDSICRDLSSKNDKRCVLKVYNDDEPLSSPTFGARFNPIFESDETEEEKDEFPGFFPAGDDTKVKSVDVTLLSEAAVISVGKTSETHAVMLKIRAPPAPMRRPPVDLVAVLNVSRNMNADMLRLMKRAMQTVVSSLSAADRLSIVAFSSTSKRLLPLRRMTAAGRRCARKIIGAVVALEDGAGDPCSGDAVKKAVKVLEDRRERNAAAGIMLFNDGRRGEKIVTFTRFSHGDIPIHSVNLSACLNSPPDYTVGKRITDCIGVAVQDLRIQLGFAPGSAPGEISAVYSYAGRPALIGSGSGWFRVGDLHPEEERELLIELKVPSSLGGAHRLLTVRCSHKDPSTLKTICDKVVVRSLPRAVGSSTRDIQWMKYLFVSTRAVAESRRMDERGDMVGARRMLASARALVLQSGSGSEFVRGLEAELAELNRSTDGGERADAKAEPLTPTSAWKAAERLAKVAIMRKSLNRVSDLHGFENARF
ncbi:Zinc finger (C3HC4-type RING finger) family protein [Striga hermonthica]|uniref:Zinc finger (C3HC4-type RING finger) family protein n=1 Tax=Striga hermonthica TaxID=68872 RepID=A0A9N7N0E3_STRHE|nr:Zinc finger (C3HC4-type RING finger) family protein [Striga hermonthica]